MPARPRRPPTSTETVENLLRVASVNYAADGSLTESALRRLAWWKARSGKACESCGEEKPLAAFSRDSRNDDGLRRYCRACASARDRARRLGRDSA